MVMFLNSTAAQYVIGKKTNNFISGLNKITHFLKSSQTCVHESVRNSFITWLCAETEV